MKSNSIFNTVATARLGRNNFDLSYDNKLSFSIGELIPTCVMECIPGDIFNINVENLLRFKPLVSPVMHRMSVTTDFFFVGNHIQWPDFDKFITGKTTPTHPFVVVAPATVRNGSLGDYLGYKSNADISAWNQNALPLGAYLKIYDDWYRADKIQTTELWSELVAGANAWMPAYLNGEPLHRSYQHDYFTACLPTAAGTDVTLPLIDDTTVDVALKTGSTVPGKLRKASDQSSLGAGTLSTGADSLIEGGGASIDAQYDPQGNLEVDINAAAATIRTLRRAFKLQQFLEAANRGGQRITEWVQTIWGENTGDARHDRSEFIGRNVQPVIVSEVLSTAEGTTTEIGSYAGHAISVGGSNKFKHHCKDHGFIIGITSVIPETAYFQGLHRSFVKTDYLDYAIPHFANIGEQEVYNYEIFSEAGVQSVMDTTFGYIPRYSELKFKNSEAHALFTTTLSHFTMARDFAALPSLNGTFLEVDSDNHKQIFADQTEDHILAHIFNNINVSRKLPKFNVPSL